MGTVGKNHPCSKEYLEQQKNRRSKNVPSKPVKSKPKSCMARSLPRPERLQRPVLTNFSSSKPPIPFPLPTGVLDSLEPMQHGLTIATRVTNTNSERHIREGLKNITMVFYF